MAGIWKYKQGCRSETKLQITTSYKCTESRTQRILKIATRVEPMSLAQDTTWFQGGDYPRLSAIKQSKLATPSLCKNSQRLCSGWQPRSHIHAMLLQLKKFVQVWPLELDLSLSRMVKGIRGVQQELDQCSYRTICYWVFYRQCCGN